MKFLLKESHYGYELLPSNYDVTTITIMHGFYGIKKVAFQNPLWILFVKYDYGKLTSLLLSLFSVRTCENMPSVCNERGFTNIHKLFNIETCTISRRPHARFFNGGLSRKKEKEKEA